MTGYEVYKLYMSMKLHFTSPSYSYFKYNGKTKVDTFDHYCRRKDKFFFEKISRKIKNEDEIKDFFLANFSMSDKWIGDLLDIDSERRYEEWKKYNDALKYNFKKELNYIKEHCEFLENAMSTEGVTHPPLFQFYLGKKVSLETLLIINSCRKFIPFWSERLKNDIIYKKKLLLFRKYREFMSFDRESYKKILDDILPIQEDSLSPNQISLQKLL
jgi:hypothetical protein